MVMLPPQRTGKNAPGKPGGNYPSEFAKYIGVDLSTLHGVLFGLPQSPFYEGAQPTVMGNLQAALGIIDELVQDDLPPVSEITHEGQFVAVSDGTEMNIYYSAPDPRANGIEYTSAPDPDEPGTFGFSYGIPGTTDYGTVHTQGVNRAEHEIGVTGNAEIRIDASFTPNERGTPPGADDNIRVIMTDVAADSMVGAQAVYSQTSLSGGIRSFVTDSAFPVAGAATATRYRIYLERQLEDDSWVDVYPEFMWVLWQPPAVGAQVERTAPRGAIGLSDLSPELRARLDPEYDIITADRNLKAIVASRFMSERIENDLHRGGVSVARNTHPSIVVDFPTVYDRSARSPSDNLAVTRTLSFDHGMAAEAFGLSAGTRAQGFLVRGMRAMGENVVWVVATVGRMPSNFTFLGPIDFYNLSEVLFSFGLGPRAVPGRANRQIDVVFKENGNAQIELDASGTSVSGSEDDRLLLGNSAYFVRMVQVRRVSATPDIYQVKDCVSGRAVRTTPASGAGAIVNNTFAGSAEFAVGNGISSASAALSFKGDLWDVWAKDYAAGIFPFSDGDMQAMTASAHAALTAGNYDSLDARNNPFTLRFGQAVGSVVPPKWEPSWVDVSAGVITVPRQAAGGYASISLATPVAISRVKGLRLKASVDGGRSFVNVHQMDPVRSMVRPVSEIETVDGQSIIFVADEGGVGGVSTDGTPRSPSLNQYAINLIGASDGAEIVDRIAFKAHNDQSFYTTGGMMIKDVQLAVQP